MDCSKGTVCVIMVLCLDFFFSSFLLLEYLVRRGVRACGGVRSRRKGGELFRMSVLYLFCFVFIWPKGCVCVST